MSEPKTMTFNDLEQWLNERRVTEVEINFFHAQPLGLADEVFFFKRTVLGKEFITVYSEIKELEFDEFMKVISPWEREHLLLHV